MATITQSRTYIRQHYLNEARSRLWVVPLGRFLFALIFILSGLNHFSSGSIGYAESAGVPYPSILVPVSGLIALLGGFSILTGFHARFGALLIILFLLPVTLMMHNFWNISDPATAQMQMIHFLKNLSMIGGALLIAFYGAGPISLDNRRARRHY